MTFVVTENCIRCRNMDCVEVCPVDCFHLTPLMVVINPDECIDCTLCEPECPSEAIFSEADLPVGQEVFLELNATFSAIYPVATEKAGPFPDAESWKGVPNKVHLITTKGDGAAVFGPYADPIDYQSLVAADEISNEKWLKIMGGDDALARGILASRSDIASDPSRIHRALRDVDPAVRRIALLREADVEPGDLDALVTDTALSVRKTLLDQYLHRLTAAQIDVLLQDSDQGLRLKLLKDHRFVPTRAQFLYVINHGTPADQALILKRLNSGLARELLKHSSEDIRAAAYGYPELELTKDDLLTGLADSSPAVRIAILDRQDFHPTRSQFRSILDSGDLRCIAVAARKASSACVAIALNHPNADGAGHALRFAPKLSAEQISIGLRHSDAAIPAGLLDNASILLETTHVNDGLRISDVNLRLKFLKKYPVSRLTPKQRAIAARDTSARVRRLFITEFAGRLSPPLVDVFLTDPSSAVREAMARRPDFKPTTAQYRHGVKDTSPTVKSVFKERFRLSQNTVLERTEEPPHGNKQPKRRLQALLDEMNGIATWTKRKHALKESLDPLLQELGYTFFRVDLSAAILRRYGEHTVTRIPANKRGVLRPMAGKSVHLVCVGTDRAMRKWFAAKPL